MHTYRTVADLHSKILDAPPPPGGPNSFNFMQFWENLAKSYVGAPWRFGAPPRENPGSAAGYASYWNAFLLNLNLDLELMLTLQIWDEEMDQEIDIKYELVERKPMADKKNYFSDKDQENHINVKKEILDKENRSPLPPPPPLTPKPPKLCEIGMKININQFKSISDPFLSDFEKIKKKEPQTEAKSPVNAKISRRGRPAKMGSLKRRRNSASSDTSQSSSCSSGTSSSQEDCTEIADGPRERTKSRTTNISNRKRLRIRDEIGNLAKKGLGNGLINGGRGERGAYLGSVHTNLDLNDTDIGAVNLNLLYRYR